MSVQGGDWPEDLLTHILETHQEGGYELALNVLCSLFAATSKPCVEAGNIWLLYGQHIS